MFRPICEIYICLSCLHEFPQQNQRPWESISFLCLYFAHFVPFVLICTFGFYLYITKFWFHKSRIKNSFLRKDYWQKRLKMVFGVFGIHEEVSLSMITNPIRHPLPFTLKTLCFIKPLDQLFLSIRMWRYEKMAHLSITNAHNCPYLSLKEEGMGQD